MCSKKSKITPHQFDHKQALENNNSRSPAKRGEGASQNYHLSVGIIVEIGDGVIQFTPTSRSRNLIFIVTINSPDVSGLFMGCQISTMGLTPTNKTAIIDIDNKSSILVSSKLKRLKTQISTPFTFFTKR